MHKIIHSDIHLFGLATEHPLEDQDVMKYNTHYKQMSCSIYTHVWKKIYDTILQFAIHRLAIQGRQKKQNLSTY